LQRALADAFAGNVTLAAQIVREAQELQSSQVPLPNPCEHLTLATSPVPMPVHPTKHNHDTSCKPLRSDMKCIACGDCGCTFLTAWQGPQGERSLPGTVMGSVVDVMSIHKGADLQVSDAADPMIAKVARPFFLDLHGLSQSAARIALLQARLPLLTTILIWHALRACCGPTVSTGMSHERKDSFMSFCNLAPI